MNHTKYKIITNKWDLASLKEQLLQDDGEIPAHPLLAFDTETNGLAHWKNVVIGFSISTSSKDGYYIPLLDWKDGQFQDFWNPEKKYPESITQEGYKPPDFIIDFMKMLYNSQFQLIMHNAPFDVLMVRANFGVDLTDNLFCDTLLLKHILDENTSCGLKETALLWQKDLKIPVDEVANQEQIDMAKSVIKNGGKFNKKGRKDIWRADLEVLGHYAAADTALTFGLFEVGMTKLEKEYEPKHFKWFFEDEVMPLCKEVVIPMKRQGMQIDVDYFNKLNIETDAKLIELEDEIINALQKDNYLSDFKKGKSVEEVANKKKLIEVFLEIEGLEIPINVKGKKSLSKDLVAKKYAETGHWIWGYILGEVECPYSEEQVNELKAYIFKLKTKHRYAFNINSVFHLRWLFCEKLKHDPKKLPQTDSATELKPIPSMDAEVIEQFFAPKYDFAKKLLTYKKLQKLSGTYIKGALNLHHNGTLYVDMFQNGTISGRFSCGGGYNLQTLPRAEDLTSCRSCGSKNVEVTNKIEILATVSCKDCKKVHTDIVCPSVIKKGIIAPKGKKIIAADYSSLEPRIFCEISTDSRLKAIFLNGWDFYSALYCDTEGKNSGYSKDPNHPRYLKKVAKNIRDEFKACALAIPYGARRGQVANLRGYKKTIYNFDGSKKEVLDFDKGQKFIDEYLGAYPDLHAFMLKQIEKAHKDGWVETFIARRRHFMWTQEVYKVLKKAGISYEKFLDESSKNLKTFYYEKQMGKTELTELLEKVGVSSWDQKKKRARDWLFVRNVYKNEVNNAINVAIQGAAAHVCNRAMLEINRRFKKEKLDSWICLQVHDEVVTYANASEISESERIIQDCMEHNEYAKLISVPLIAEPKVALNMRDAK
jgi:DNA polymerase I-like protein with 3'-5' exonuclease and polymerase domains